VFSFNNIGDFLKLDDPKAEEIKSLRKPAPRSPIYRQIKSKNAGGG
jgi:hypothetical protein